MRVALISETFLPSVNGITTTLCRMLDHLAAHRHDALVIAPHDAPPSYAGFSIVSLPSVPLPFYPEVKVTPPRWNIAAQLRRFGPDVVHVVGPVVLGAAATLAALQLRLPIVSSYHTNFGTYSTHYGLGYMRAPLNAYLRLVHNRSAMTLCPSRATLRELHAQGFRRLRVWGRGVDTDRFHPHHRSLAWREAMGVEAGETVLLYVGRLANEKRLDVLADALPALPNVRLLIVGDGPVRARLTQRMAGLPVHFTGYLEGHALATAYASADVFVFPSDTETFGQVVQEAMASGLPVVGARGGGTLDLVQDGTTGRLFTPGCVPDLVAQLGQLLLSPAQGMAMGAAARAYAQQRSWSRVIDQLLEHYRRAMLRAPRGQFVQSVR